MTGRAAPPHLTRTLVSLKLRLLRNRARRGPAALQLALAAVGGLVVAVGLALDEADLGGVEVVVDQVLDGGVGVRALALTD